MGSLLRTWSCLLWVIGAGFLQCVLGCIFAFEIGYEMSKVSARWNWAPFSWLWVWVFNDDLVWIRANKPFRILKESIMIIICLTFHFKERSSLLARVTRRVFRFFEVSQPFRRLITSLGSFLVQSGQVLMSRGRSWSWASTRNNSVDYILVVMLLSCLGIHVAVWAADVKETLSTLNDLSDGAASSNTVGVPFSSWWYVLHKTTHFDFWQFDDDLFCRLGLSNALKCSKIVTPNEVFSIYGGKMLKKIEENKSIIMIKWRLALSFFIIMINKWKISHGL